MDNYVANGPRYGVRQTTPSVNHVLKNECPNLKGNSSKEGLKKAIDANDIRNFD